MAFDQGGKLWQQSQNLTFDTDFSEQTQNLTDTTNLVVMHFFQNDCDCNSVADEHINSVIELAKRKNYQNKQLDMANVPELAKYIPATPAVAIFGQDGRLTYLGPYSAGYSCSVGNGIVESYLEGTSAQSLGATIVTDTQGCYCPL